MSEGAFRTAGMVVSAVFAAAIVLAAVALFLRNDDNAPIQILPPPQEPASGQPTPTSDDDVRVYISGAVQNPGPVYPMLPGDRLSDAVAAAGGPSEDAQLAAVNLALRVTDQAHYHIPIVGETPAPQAGQVQSWGGMTPPDQADASTDGLINFK